MKRLTKYDEFGNAELVGIDNTKLYERLVCDETVALTIATNKLGELEDVLEKHNIESVEELDLILQGLKNIHQENANLKQELAELKRKAIVPKFKIGQEVWWIDTRVNSFNEQRYRIESYLIDSIVITKEQFRYYGDDGLWLGDDELFATKEEAKQKLAKIKGEKDEKRY